MDVAVAGAALGIGVPVPDAAASTHPTAPALWQALPGRALPLATLDAMGLAQSWQPITLALGATLRTALVCVWLCAFLLAVLRLSTADLQRFVRADRAAGPCQRRDRFVQIISHGTALIFYPSRQSMFLSGLFANKKPYRPVHRHYLPGGLCCAVQPRRVEPAMAGDRRTRRATLLGGTGGDILARRDRAGRRGYLCVAALLTGSRNEGTPASQGQHRHGGRHRRPADRADCAQRSGHSFR